MSTKHIVHRIVEPGLSGTGITAPEAAAVRAAIERIDPGIAGTDRQSLRIVDGVPTWADAPTFFARDYVSGSPSEDATAGLNALIAAAQSPYASSGLYGATIVFEPGEYRLTGTVDWQRFTGRIIGSSPGTSPAASGGAWSQGTVFRWDGPADQPMFRIMDSRMISFENLRMQGKDTAIPSHAFLFHKESAHANGPNMLMSLRDIWIGPWPWNSSGSAGGLVKCAVGMTGFNSDNDRLFVQRLKIQHPTECGIYIENPQSVSGSIRDTTITGKSTGPFPTGISTGATLALDNVLIQFCNPDIETTVVNAVVHANQLRSEQSRMIARLHHSGTFSISNSYLAVGHIIANGGVMIDAFPSDSLTLNLSDVWVPDNTNPAMARIEVGPQSPRIGRFLINVERARGMSKNQIVFPAGASMWASSPMSKGVIQWQSVYNDDIHQFRNELRRSGAGTRQTIDRNAWDTPVTD